MACSPFRSSILGQHKIDVGPFPHPVARPARAGKDRDDRAILTHLLQAGRQRGVVPIPAPDVF